MALLVVLIAYGGFQSTTGIAIVAFSKEQGYEAYAGFVTACFSIASPTGALVYGMRAWRWPLWKRFYLSLTAVAIGCSALVFVNSMWTAELVMFVAGLFQAPTIVNINQMIIKMIPASRLTEGMAFQSSLWVVGISSANLIFKQGAKHPSVWLCY